MADRTIHYEAAFESLLRERRIPYVCVDEAKMALFAHTKLKSFDFVVHSKAGPNLLVDVKGRSLRDRAARSGFESWSPEQDVTDLLEWEQLFGTGFQAILAFVYWIDPPLVPEDGMFSFRDKWYLAMGIRLDEYRAHMRRRSAKWSTVCLRAADFRSVAKPLDAFL